MSEQDFSMSVRLRHDFGRWRVQVSGDRDLEAHDQDVTAEKALELAQFVAGAPRRVKEIIRKDADDAEERAKAERKRAQDETQRLAGAAFDADVKARERRAEADRLAPVSEQPPPFTVE